MNLHQVYFLLKVTSQPITATTLHQSSIVRWISLTDLLESIKRSYDAFRITLIERKEDYQIDEINMITVQQLIDFLQLWKNILCEIQKGNLPSLFVVLSCITFLKVNLISPEKKEKQEMDINIIGFCF